MFFRGEEAGLAEGFLVGEGFEALAEGVEIVGGVADAEFGYAVGGEAAAGEVFAGEGAFGGAKLVLEPGAGGFVEVEEFGALAVFGGFFRGGEVAFGEGNAAFLGDGADGFGEAEVFDFLDEGEDVSMLVAAEAVEVLAADVDAEGGGFFFVEGAEAAVVLGAGFFEADVVVDDFYYVGLLLYLLGEVGGHGIEVR